MYLSAQAHLPQKVILCGVGKNVESSISYSMKIMEKIGSLFSDYRIIIYENNSSDDTPSLVKQWAENNDRVFAISEYVEKNVLEKILVNRLDNNDFHPPEAIARARNIVLKHALSDVYKDFDYLIWMDMDFIIEPNYEGFEEIFTTTQEWDAVFAYGIKYTETFWDFYAFRDPCYPLGSELLGNDWWYLPKSLVFKKNDPWYPVYSAFGGCGIYKKSSLKGCSYSALVTDDLEQFSHTIIEKHSSHPMVKKYFENLKNLNKTVFIPSPQDALNDIRDKSVGIITHPLFNKVIWRMSSYAYKYPSVCEHVPLHASMIIRGHDKLFINPRLVFHY